MKHLFLIMLLASLSFAGEFQVMIGKINTIIDIVSPNLKIQPTIDFYTDTGENWTTIREMYAEGWHIIQIECGVEKVASMIYKQYTIFMERN